MSCPRAHPALTQHFILQHTHDHWEWSWEWFLVCRPPSINTSIFTCTFTFKEDGEYQALRTNSKYSIQMNPVSSASSSPWHWRWISFLHFNQMSESFREWYALFYITLPSQAAYPCNVENPVAGTLCVPRASSRAGYFREANPKSTKIHLGYPLSSIFV